MKTLYVITNPELGWDCVVDVCEDEAYVNQTYGNNPDRFIIHEKVLNICVAKNIDTCIKYKIIDESKTEDMDLLIDTLEITTIDGEFNATKNRESTIFICEKYEEFCKENEITPDEIYLSTIDNNWFAVTDELKVSEDIFMDWLKERGIDCF